MLQPSQTTPTIAQTASLPDATPEGVPIPVFEPWRARRVRLSGWTADVQLAFIAALTRLGCANAAAKAVGKSRRSAYLLREKPGAESFAAAWEEAVMRGRRHAQSVAISRALHGDLVPQFRNGQFSGYKLVSNDRLLIAAISSGPTLRAGTHPSVRGADGAREQLSAQLSEMRHRLENWEVALKKQEMALSHQAVNTDRADESDAESEEAWAEAWERHVIWREQIQLAKRREVTAEIREAVRRSRAPSVATPPSVRVL